MRMLYSKGSVYGPMAYGYQLLGPLSEPSHVPEVPSRPRQGHSLLKAVDYSTKSPATDAAFEVGELASPQRPIVATTNALEDDFTSIVAVEDHQAVLPHLLLLDCRSSFHASSGLLQELDHLPNLFVHEVHHRMHQAAMLILDEGEPLRSETQDLLI